MAADGAGAYLLRLSDGRCGGQVRVLAGLAEELVAIEPPGLVVIGFAFAVISFALGISPRAIVTPLFARAR